MSGLKSRTVLLSPARAGLFLLLLAACLVQPARASAPNAGGLICRPELSDARRREVAERLREITGWSALRFDADGVLRFGEAQPPRGSATARELLEKAARGVNLIVLEDASDRAEVVFSRVIPGRWTRDAERKPPVFILQVDFADFARVTGDRDALASFNVGWGVLHEISHVVNDSFDTRRSGEVGECESLVNRMRRECGLAERAEYHFYLVPGVERGDFKTRYVRLAFEQQNPLTNKKRRLWLVWDANLVGGLNQQRQ